MKKTIVLLMVLFYMSSSLAQKIYKWVDENGQVHYSSKEPLDKKSERMKIKTQKAQSVTTKPESDENEEENDSEKDAEEEVDPKTKKELEAMDKKNKKRMCAQAKANLKSLQDSPRVVQKDPKSGEMVRLDDNQRISALKNARKNIKEFCR